MSNLSSSEYDACSNLSVRLSEIIESLENSVYEKNAMSKGVCLIANNHDPHIDHLPEIIESLENSVYERNAMSKGVCLIANNRDPHIDHLPFKEALMKKGIKVEASYHLPWSRIKSWIKRVLRNKHHSYNFVIFCMLADGYYGAIQDGHGGNISISKILNLFTQDKCPLYKHKPRIVLIEAGQEYRNIRRSKSAGNEKASLPEPNLFLGLSTQAGYRSSCQSFVGETYQSVFFKALTQALQNGTTLNDVTQKAYRIMEQMQIPIENRFGRQFQTPFYSSTLAFDVYLG